MTHVDPVLVVEGEGDAALQGVPGTGTLSDSSAFGPIWTPEGVDPA